MNVDDFELLGPWVDEAPLVGAVVLPIDRAGRIYLQFRDHGAPRYPGKWGLFGGVVEPGEGWREAAVRELAEETGLAAAPELFEPFARTISPETGAQNFAFVARLDIAPADLRILEGGGFGAFVAEDIAKLDLVPFTRLVIEHWFTAEARELASM